MSITHLQLVNQKLAFANSIVTSISSPSGGTAITQKLQVQALKDSAVFHLITALHFYVRELAELHRVANVQTINSIDDLSRALDKLDKVSPEVLELTEILHAAGSWLNQLTRYHSQLFRSPEKEKEKKAFAQKNIIETVDITNVSDEAPFNLTAEILTDWSTNFRALIARQRETMSEY